MLTDGFQKFMKHKQNVHFHASPATLRYSLFAVVIHSGTLEVGHYMCYVRQEKDQVTRVYMGFYLESCLEF